MDINNAGDIVGDSDLAQSNSLNFHATLWRHGTPTDLGTLGGKVSSAMAINEAGVIVGWAWLPDYLGTHAAVWRDGVIHDLNDYRDADMVAAGWQLIEAYDIDESGCIVGLAQDGNGKSRAFLVSPLVPSPPSAAPVSDAKPQLTAAGVERASVSTASAGGGGATGLMEVAALALLCLLTARRLWKRR
jgi:probable HAF family extracellular repeat protein